MTKENMQQDDQIELDVINLVFEDPEDPNGEVEVECGIIGIFESGSKDYIALVVPDEDEDDNLEEVIYIYEYSEDEDENPILDNIESEEEYNSVVETFNEIYLVE